MDNRCPRQCRRMYRFLSANKKQGSFQNAQILTSTARPTRPRSRCSSRKPACRTRLIPVDTRKGDQFKPEFLAVNPNGKVPAIVDDDVVVFDSNAILLYLAEKTGKFLPPARPPAAAQLLSWLMFVATGVGPYLRPGRAFQAPRAGEDRTTPTTATSTRRSAITASSTTTWPRAATWSATPTASSTWTFWGWARLAPFVHGRETLCETIPTSSGWSTRSAARPAAARARSRSKDKHHLQGRDGRRGAPQHHVRRSLIETKAAPHFAR